MKTLALTGDVLASFEAQINGGIGLQRTLSTTDHQDLLRNRKLVSGYKLIERFLTITCGLPNIMKCQFIVNELFVRFVDFFCDGHGGRHRVCIQLRCHRLDAYP